MSVNIYDPNTGQLQKIAGLFGNENIGIPKAGTYISDVNSNADNIKALDTALVNVNQAVVNVSNKVSNNSDAYSDRKDYKTGDLVIRDNTLHICIQDCSAASWLVNSSCFTVDTLTNVIKTALSKEHWTKIAEVNGDGTTTWRVLLNSMFSAINHYLDGNYDLLARLVYNGSYTYLRLMRMDQTFASFYSIINTSSDMRFENLYFSLSDSTYRDFVIINHTTGTISYNDVATEAVIVGINVQIFAKEL